MAARSPDPAPPTGATVERVVVRRLERPVAPPLVSGIHKIAMVAMNVVEVTSAGRAGLGYTYAFSRREAESVTPLLLHLGEPLVGRALDPRATTAEAWRRINFIGRGGPPVMALSALDVACWDLHAQLLGIPLHAALGAPRSEHEVYVAAGSLALGPEELAAEARELLAAGYAGYKLRVGGPDLDRDVERVRAVAAAIDPGAKLMVDANQAWTRAEAGAFAGRLEDLELTFFEEPIDAEDLEGLAALTASAPMPIAAGESNYGPRRFADLLAGGCLDVLQPDLMRCGGISGYLEILAAAAAAGLPVHPHLFTEIAPHLPSGDGPGPQLIEHLPGWFDDVFAGAPRPDRGRLSPGDAPGLGLSLSPLALERYVVGVWE
jgi:L-alanine-DL-glutamate epimerase-like enolase superfamily enzyme